MELSLKLLNFILLLEHSRCVRRKEGLRTTDVPSLQYILLCEHWAWTSAYKGATGSARIPFMSLLYPPNPWCVKVGHTTGVYVPYSFRTVVWVLFLRVDFQCRVIFTCVKFTFANKIEAMHERSLVKRKSWTSLNFSFKLSPFYLVSILCVNVRNLKRVSGNQPWRDNRESVNRLHDNAQKSAMKCLSCPESTSTKMLAYQWRPCTAFSVTFSTDTCER